MNVLKELRQRRVPQYVSAYIVGSWGLVQAVTFLEERLMLSPHWVNLVALALVMLLPSVVVLAWCHGRPGRDRWGRPEKLSVPINFIAASLMMFVLFSDKDLGAVTQTVEVRDENGTVIERVIPKNEFIRRAIIYYFENKGDTSDNWMRQGLATGLAVDVSQDVFTDMESLILWAATLRREGYPDGIGVPRPLQRKLARDAHCPNYVTGSFARQDQDLVLDLEIHDTKTGRTKASEQFTASDIYEMIDTASVWIRRELGVPAAHIESQEDLPVAEITSSEPEAFRKYMESVSLAMHDNDWQAASIPLAEAVEIDPTFALAHFMHYAVQVTVGDVEGGNASMTEAMKYLYRLTERTQFQIKAIYYFNVKPEANKTMAVMEMWSRLYPNDLAAYKLIAMFAGMRNERQTVITALEMILEIDPAQFQILHQLAVVHQDNGDYSIAEPLLLRYAELNPTDIHSYTQLAALYVDSGKLEEARVALEDAQMISPNHVEIAVELAKIDAREGNFSAAESALKELLAAADNDEDRLDVVGDLTSIYEAQGRWHEGCQNIDLWCQLARNSVIPSQIPLARAIRLARMTTPDRADSLCLVINKIRDEVGDINKRALGLYKSKILIAAGRLDEAEAGIIESTEWIEQYKVEVMRPRVLAVEADLLAARGDLEQSLTTITTAAELDPASGRLQRQLGRIQRLNGKFDLAKETLGKSLTKNPGHPRINLELALLWDQQGQTEKALPYLEKALSGWQQADVGHPGAIEARQLAEKLGLAR